MGDLPLFMILGGLLEWIILNPDSDRMYVCDETLVVEFLFLRKGFIIQLFYIKTGVVFFLMFGRKISLSSLVNAFFTRNLSQFFFLLLFCVPVFFFTTLFSEYFLHRDLRVFSSLIFVTGASGFLLSRLNVKKLVIFNKQKISNFYY